MSTSPSRPPARWYLLAVLPLALAASLVLFFGKLRHDEVVHMQRVLAPGSGEVVLAPGRYVGYGETARVVDGRSDSAPKLAVRCTMVEEASGLPVELTA